MLVEVNELLGQPAHSWWAAAIYILWIYKVAGVVSSTDGTGRDGRPVLDQLGWVALSREGEGWTAGRFCSPGLEEGERDGMIDQLIRVLCFKARGRRHGDGRPDRLLTRP